jgi:acetyl esterase/lipase
MQSVFVDRGKGKLALRGSAVLRSAPMRMTFILWLLLAVSFSHVRAADDLPKFTRTEDVIYGRKFGTALTLDVFQPEKPNKCAVFFVVSGGFFSSHDAINARFYAPLLERGYTVFAVVHGSQPRFHIPEITQDIHRAVRFIRQNAAKYGIDPNRFGITGASAGGHLSLTLGTQGGPGRSEAKDPVERESSAVQAVACFFPPTDFKEISPINFVSSNTAPTMIIHGDLDRLVPIQQAKIFEERCRKENVPFKLVVKEGKDHGWREMDKDMALCADWFDEHLRKR